MKYLIVLSVFAIAMMAGAAPFANPPTGIPDMENSWIEMPCGLCPDVVLFNVPNGTGSAFTLARDITGTVDATITLFLRDGNNDPIANYPREDMSLVGLQGGENNWISCPSGTIADYDTDVNGETTWTYPLRAGGWNVNGYDVMINGGLMGVDSHMPQSNSSDINGDLVVNLTDVALFAGDFYDNVNYFFRSDFHYDGVINLSDVAKMAQSIGAACP